MSGSTRYYAKWNKSEKDKYNMISLFLYDLTFMWTLKHKINEHIQQNISGSTDTKNKQVFVRKEVSMVNK